MTSARWISVFLLIASGAFARSSHQVFDAVYGSISTACSQVADADNQQTTVDQNSASGQKVLYVAATLGISVGEHVLIHSGGAREEVCEPASITPTVSITCVGNLTYTHTAAQADDVHITNRIGPLTTGRQYTIYCHNGSGVGSSCECAVGTAVVSPRKDAYVLVLAGTKKTIYLPIGSAYVACIPYSANQVFDVCPLQ